MILRVTGFNLHTGNQLDASKEILKEYWLLVARGVHISNGNVFLFYFDVTDDKSAICVRVRVLEFKSKISIRVHFDN